MPCPAIDGRPAQRPRLSSPNRRSPRTTACSPSPSTSSRYIAGRCVSSPLSRTMFALFHAQQANSSPLPTVRWDGPQDRRPTAVMSTIGRTPAHFTLRHRQPSTCFSGFRYFGIRPAQVRRSSIGTTWSPRSSRLQRGGRKRQQALPASRPRSVTQAQRAVLPDGLRVGRRGQSRRVSRKAPRVHRHDDMLHG